MYIYISPPHIQQHVNSFRFQKTPWFTGSVDGHSNEWQGGMRSTKGGGLLPPGDFWLPLLYRSVFRIPELPS